jgi:ATP-dependent DNA helicase RecG
VFSGKVGVFNKKLQLTHPQFETLDEDDEIRPFISVYPATGKLGSQVIARSVRQVLDMVDDVADPLPSSVRERESLAELSRALRRIHVPESQNDIFAARHRLVWDEAMGVQLALALRRRATAARPAAACPPRPAACWRRSTPGCRSRSPTGRRRWGRRSPPISPGGTR